MTKRKLTPATLTAFEELSKRAKEAGTSIYKLCQDLGVHYQTLHKWKQRDPDSIATLRKFEAKLKEIEASRQ